MQTTTARIVNTAAILKVRQLIAQGLVSEELQNEVEALISEIAKWKKEAQTLKTLNGELNVENAQLSRIMRDAVKRAELEKEAHRRFENYKIYAIVFAAVLTLASVCTAICSLIIR